MIRNDIFDKGKSIADKDKLMTYIPFQSLKRTVIVRSRIQHLNI